MFCGLLLIGLFGMGKMLLVCVIVGEVGVLLLFVMGVVLCVSCCGDGVWVCDLFG